MWSKIRCHVLLKPMYCMISYFIHDIQSLYFVTWNAFYCFFTPLWHVLQDFFFVQCACPRVLVLFLRLFLSQPSHAGCLLLDDTQHSKGCLFQHNALQSTIQPAIYVTKYPKQTCKESSALNSFPYRSFAVSWVHFSFSGRQ